MQNYNVSFLINLYRCVRFKDASRYLYKRLFHNVDPHKEHIRLKNDRTWISGWGVEQLKFRQEHFVDDLYIWNLKGRKWLGSLIQIEGLYEYLNDVFDLVYQTDYRGKTVLDIGGFIGDSALYALQKGAKKVIIYEPVKKNIQCMKFNLKELRDQVEIIPKALSENSEEVSIYSETPEGSVGFGFSGQGKYALQASSENISAILSKRHIDIAKVDCEGGEKHLLKAEPAVLRNVHEWLIETHSESLLMEMNRKFIESGFKIVRGPWPNVQCGISYYHLI